MGAGDNNGGSGSSTPVGYRSLRIFHQDSHDSQTEDEGSGGSVHPGSHHPGSRGSGGAAMSPLGRDITVEEEETMRLYRRTLREDFYRTFKDTIKMGNAAPSKQHHHHQKRLPKDFEMRGRRGSQLFFGPSNREKHEFGEVLWLEIQAFLSGRAYRSKTEKLESARAHDDWLVRQRDESGTVMNEILAYFNGPSSDQTSSGKSSIISTASEMMFPGLSKPTFTIEETFSAPNTTARTIRSKTVDATMESIPSSNFADTTDDTSQPSTPTSRKLSHEPTSPHSRKLSSRQLSQSTYNTPHDIFTNNYIRRQQEALQNVGGLLHRWETFESLYPTGKTMRSILGAERYTTSLKDRLNVLYLWFNITRDLCRGIKSVGQMLGMKEYWPNLDYTSPQFSPCNSSEEDDNNDDDDDDDEDQQPKGALVSPSQSLLNLISMSPSSTTGDFDGYRLDRNIYRKFVEKSLRLRGMRKVLIRLGNVMGKTLSKARKTLEKRPSDQSRPPNLRHSMPLPHPLSSSTTGGSNNINSNHPGTTTMTISPPPTSTASSGRMHQALYIKNSHHQRAAAQLSSSSSMAVSKTVLQNNNNNSNLSSPVKKRRGASTTTPIIITVSNNHHVLGTELTRESEQELNQYGQYHQAWRDMNLLSIYPSFLYLLKIPLSLVHEWLKLRVEQKTSRNPDLFTLKTLIQDCHDCLNAAVEVKTFYHEYIQATTNDEALLDKLLVGNLRNFDDDLREMYQTYLEYVRAWGVGHSKMEQMSTTEGSQTVLDLLEQEWKFAKRIAINVLNGEHDAALRFCQLSSTLLQDMVLQFLDRKRQDLDRKQMDNYMDDLGEPLSMEDTPIPPGAMGSNHQTGAGLPGAHGYHGMLQHQSRSIASSSYLAYCRDFRSLWTEVRERALRSLALSKTLRNDLEISAKFNRICSQEELLQLLLDTQHVLVTTPHSLEEFMMFCEPSVANNEEQLQLLLNVTCGRDESEVPNHLAQLNGYLLLVKCEQKGEKESWKGDKRHVVPDADTGMSLYNMQVDAVYLVVVSSRSLSSQREALRRHVSKSDLKLVDEQCSCHELIGERLNNLKELALTVQEELARNLREMSDDLGFRFDDLNANERANYRDTVSRAYDFMFEYHKELTKLISAQYRKTLARATVDFAKEWVNFVLNKSDPGHGVRPRWAHEGLNFLVLAVNPDFTEHLTDEEFKRLTSNISRCIKHIIGPNKTPTSPPVHPNSFPALNNTGSSKASPTNSPDTSSSSGYVTRTTDGFAEVKYPAEGLPGVPPPPPVLKPSYSSQTSLLSPSPSSTSTTSLPISASLMHTSHTSPSGLGLRRSMFMSGSITDRRKKQRDAVHQLEVEKQKDLEEKRRIGRCVETTDKHINAQIDGKKLNFSWQRMEKKIGEGKFGTVYQAINLDTSGLMAVKQISIERKDHRMMKLLIDEIKHFIEISHENLVKYFGVEVHRDEVLIFMEYCDWGTLESICRESLHPIIIRQYTHYLLRGVIHLHQNNIVHRDIKPGNIFLTSSSAVLKLGDFGSSAQLHHATTNAGELTDYVGTPMYMAPEIITGSRSGYGRSADIWSIGCVVLEMATGKFPWHECQHLQIIWKVGNGGVPPIPESLQMKTKDFLSKCLVNKHPEGRWTASKLIEHDFAMLLEMVDPDTVVENE